MFIAVYMLLKNVAKNDELILILLIPHDINAEIKIEHNFSNI